MWQLQSRRRSARIRDDGWCGARSQWLVFHGGLCGRSFPRDGAHHCCRTFYSSGIVSGRRSARSRERHCSRHQRFVLTSLSPTRRSAEQTVWVPTGSTAVYSTATLVDCRVPFGALECHYQPRRRTVAVVSLVFVDDQSCDGHWVHVSWSAGPCYVRQVTLWHGTDTTAPVFHWVSQTEQLRCVDYSPYFDVLCFGGTGCSPALYVPESHFTPVVLQESEQAHRSPIRHVSFVPNTPEILSIDDEGTVKVWDIRNFSARFPVCKRQHQSAASPFRGWCRRAWHTGFDALTHGAVLTVPGCPGHGCRVLPPSPQLAAAAVVVGRALSLAISR